jgi:hypothetical protein
MTTNEKPREEMSDHDLLIRLDEKVTHFLENHEKRISRIERVYGTITFFLTTTILGGLLVGITKAFQ